MSDARNHHPGREQRPRGSWQDQDLRPRRVRGRSRQQVTVGVPIREHLFEVLIRIGLIGLFILTESLEAFIRIIHPEEIWMYRYPIPEVMFFESVGGPVLAFLFDPMMMIGYPLVMLAIAWYFLDIPIREVRQAVYAFTLSVPLTGVLINLIKCFVGRPRPDFLARCYGNNNYMSYMDVSTDCNSEEFFIQDGRKSFPSGHAGLAATCFSFIAIYICGQVGSFRERNKNRNMAFSVFLPLMFLPILVGISRTCDYKHHWQDVVVGGLIGYSVSYFCYRIYFPSLGDDRSHMSYQALEVYYKDRRNRGTFAGSAQNVFRAAQFFNTSDSSRSPSPEVDQTGPANSQDEGAQEGDFNTQPPQNDSGLVHRARQVSKNNNRGDVPAM